MSDRLAAYLHDHLSGARVAIDLLETLREKHDDPALRRAAAELLVEVDADREQLQAIADHVGGDAGRMKVAIAWLGEKTAPTTARLAVDTELGTLEVLEMLTLGVLGKRALWQALESLPKTRGRLPRIDYARLLERAQSQYAELESQRIRAARQAFAAPATRSQ